MRLGAAEHHDESYGLEHGSMVGLIREGWKRIIMPTILRESKQVPMHRATDRRHGSMTSVRRIVKERPRDTCQEYTILDFCQVFPM